MVIMNYMEIHTANVYMIISMRSAEGNTNYIWLTKGIRDSDLQLHHETSNGAYFELGYFVFRSDHNIWV